MSVPTQTYAGSVMSDDLDYDIISNGPRSLDSSILDFCHDMHEPPATDAAKEKLKTVSLSAEDIQAYVKKALGSSASEKVSSDTDRKTLRVYVDGVFDGFHAGHALQLRQAKLSFPFVHLMVGIFTEELCRTYDHTVTLPHVERCEVVRHCRWVDEIVPDAPWIATEEFLRERKIDFLALDEGTSVDPDCDRPRLKGYDLLKSLGRVIPTRKTFGLTVLPRPTETAPVPLTPIRTGRTIYEEEDIPEPVDVFGIGF